MGNSHKRNHKRARPNNHNIKTQEEHSPLIEIRDQNAQGEGGGSV